MCEQELAQLGARDDEAAERRVRDDVARWGLAEQDGDLAEELATLKARSLLPVQDEAGLSLEDHVDVRAREALPEDALARGDDFLVEGVRDLLELGPVEIGEEAQPGEGRG